MAVYVVTGGAGFIGANIVERLVEDGHEVRVVDDLSTGRIENLDGLLDRVAFHRQNICDGDALGRVCRGADYVLHQAALASVQRSVEQPVATNRANVEGTLMVLTAARDNDVRRVVYASSSSVYGDAASLPKHEEMTPAPLSPYAVSKLAGEHYCAAFAHVFGLSTVALRYFNVFGPRQDPNSPYAAVVPIFMRCLLSGETPEVFGDGEQSRDFTYIENVVQANLLAAEAELPEGRHSVVCNVGSGERHTLNELLETLGEMVGTPAQARYGPERPGDVRHSLADISRAGELVGYEPTVGFREGLRRTLEWYRQRT